MTTHIAVFCPRRSGSNWMESLILKNFDDVKLHVHDPDFKHGPPYRSPEDWKVLWMTKNPYSWMYSIRKFARDTRVIGGTPREFIEKCADLALIYAMQFGVREPGRDWLNACVRYEDAVHVRYEDAIPDPTSEVERMAEQWGLPLVHGEVRDITNYVVADSPGARVSDVSFDRSFYTEHRYLDELDDWVIEETQEAVNGNPWDKIFRDLGHGEFLGDWPWEVR